MSTAVLGSDFYVRPAAQKLAAQKLLAPRLHLTQRGRAVLTALVATPLVIAALVFAVNGGGATATLGSGGAFDYVTVESGQSLWMLAEELAPGADPRDVISQLMRLNALESPELFAGQELAIPAQYAD